MATTPVAASAGLTRPGLLNVMLYFHATVCKCATTEGSGTVKFLGAVCP